MNRKINMLVNGYRLVDHGNEEPVCPYSSWGGNQGMSAEVF